MLYLQILVKKHGGFLACRAIRISTGRATSVDAGGAMSALVGVRCIDFFWAQPVFSVSLLSPAELMEPGLAFA